jgi:hypothetical protein
MITDYFRLFKMSFQSALSQLPRKRRPCNKSQHGIGTIYCKVETDVLNNSIRLSSYIMESYRFVFTE